jgi:hypothetical protein
MNKIEIVEMGSLRHNVKRIIVTKSQGYTSNFITEDAK